MRVLDDPSSNFGERKDGKKPAFIVLHYTGCPTLEDALHLLKGGRAGHDVSAHYVVGEDGAIIRLVDESKRAWHAGRAWWRGEDDMNSASIGIEIQNPGHEHGYRPFPPAQITAVAELCTDIQRRHTIPPRNVLAHSDIAPARKQDPGELFPWQDLARQGIGVWPDDTVAPEGQDIRTLLLVYGYDPRLATDILLTAFHRRFVPEAFVENNPESILNTKTYTRLYNIVEKYGFLE